MTEADYIAALDRLTQANLDLQKQLNAAKVDLHDRFMLAAIATYAGARAESSTAIAEHADRIAEACMRVKARRA